MVNVPQQVAFEDEAQLVVDSFNIFTWWLQLSDIQDLRMETDE